MKTRLLSLASLMRIAAIALVLVMAAPLLAQSAGSYRITRRYVLAGDGGWDYIVPDPPNHRLFIARQNQAARGRAPE